MTCITPAERVLLNQRLAEAEKAYHDLNLGLSARVVVDQNGERVEFTAANRTGLYNYIQELKNKLGCNTIAGRPNNGPAGFVF